MTLHTNTTTPICETCGFFVPHYVRINRKFTLCGVGHCTHGRRCKQRRLSALCCPQYQLRT